MAGINRFCVMATLQAARAHLLGLKLEEAYSWGLNKAIFYAAAKRGFKGGSGRTSELKATENRPPEARPDVFRLGDDMAFREVRGGRMTFCVTTTGTPSCPRTPSTETSTSRTGIH